MRVRVECPWTATYDPALKVAAGEPVTLRRRDDEWPGWAWCENRWGLGGWLPEDLVCEGRALADFDSTELNAQAGDLVSATRRHAGWALCRADDGRTGWVPASCLADIRG